MECKDFQNLISGYMDGELNPQDRASFESHLNSCSECGKLLAEMDSLDGFLKEAPAPLPDEAYWSGFHARLEEKIQKLSPKTPWWNFWKLFRRPMQWAMAGALAVMVVVLALVPILNQVIRPVPMPLPQKSVKISPTGMALPSVQPELAPPFLSSGGDIKEESYPQEKGKSDMDHEAPAPVAKSRTKVPSSSAVEGASPPAPGGLVASEPLSEEMKPAGESPVQGNRGGFSEDKSEKKDKEQELNDKMEARMEAMGGAGGGVPSSSQVDKAYRKGTLDSKSSFPMGSASPGKALSEKPSMVAKPSAPLPEEEEDLSIKDESRDLKDENIKKEESKKVPSVSDGVSLSYGGGASGSRTGIVSGISRDTYLAQSEIIIIRVLNMSPDSQELDYLQSDLRSINYLDNLNKNISSFKSNPHLEKHAREMKNIAEKIMKTGRRSDMNELKRMVVESGILEETRNLRE